MRTRGKRPVEQYTLAGEKIGSYGSIREAQAIYGKATHISSVCSGRRKTDAGYIWKYAEDAVKKSCTNA